MSPKKSSCFYADEAAKKVLLLMAGSLSSRGGGARPLREDFFCGFPKATVKHRANFWHYKYETFWSIWYFSNYKDNLIIVDKVFDIKSLFVGNIEIILLQTKSEPELLR